MFDGAIAATVDAAPADTASTDNGHPAIVAESFDGNSVCGVDLLEPAAVAPFTPVGAGTTVVFVDARVQDTASLLQNLTPGTEVVYLDGDQDGLQQIADYLAQQQDVGSIQIIAHGNDGDLHLGSTYLSSDNISEHATELAAIGSGIAAGGDILIFACDTAAGEQGLSFVTSLAQLTGRDVAASDDRTGARGDFELEVSTGSIEAAAVLAPTTVYAHDLAIHTVTSNADSGAGTLRNTISAAASGDTITFNAGMTINLTSAHLAINKNLTIDGDLDNNGTADVTLDANYNSRVLIILGGTVNLDGLVIREGRQSANGGGYGSPAGGFADGAGVTILGGTTTISNSTITANVAAGGGGGGSGSGYSYGGGGGGGFNGIGGGRGGDYSADYYGYGGSNGVGGRGGSYDGAGAAQAGKGGSTVGGMGGSATIGYVMGGNGGTAGTIGGGGGGAGASQGATGGAGGGAAGGIYISTNATLILYSSTVSGNLGAGGGGGGGTSTGGNGGVGVGGIFNAGTLNYQSTTVTFSGNIGGGGSGGGSNVTAGTTGASFTNLNTGGTINSNFTPPGSNTAPAIANLNGDSVSYTEGGSATLLDAATAATVTDADSANFDTGNVTVAIVTNRVAGEDVLSVRNEGTAAGQIGVSGSNITFANTTIGTFTGGTGTNNLVITLNASATPTAVQALVRNLTYSNSNSTDPTTTTRTVRVTVNDGDGGTSSNQDVSVSVVGVNDAPTLTATGGTPTYTENGSAVDLFSSVSISTIESGQTITGLTLSVTNVANGASEILRIDGTDIALVNGNSGTTATNSVSYSVSVVAGTATITLSSGGGLSTANAQTLVDGMSYRNASDAPSTTSRVVTLTSITDSGGTSNGGVNTTSLATAATVAVAAVNDAPNITAPGSISVTEDVATALTGISFSDVDAGSASVTVTLSVASGTLSATSGGGVTVGGTSTARTLTGSIANINTFIAGSNVTFQTANNATSNITLTVAIDDGGNTGSDPGTSGTGSSEASATTVTLSVSAVNDAPIANVPPTISVVEDTATAITGITFADVDSGSSSVTVTFSVDSGALAATSGGGVTVGGTSTALTLTGSRNSINTFIAGSNVTFTPASNATSDVTLTTTINDNGNTGSGGAKTDTETTTLQITAVNDTPSITAPGSISVIENVATALTGVSFSDVDAGSASVTVTLSVASGTLAAASGGGVTVGGTTTALTLTGSIANINTFIAGSNVSFTTASNATSNVTLTVDIDDGGNTGAGGPQTNSTTVTLAVTAVNDAPTVTVPATLAVNEDTTTALIGISFADADAGSGSVTVTFAVPTGTLAASSGGGVTVGGTATALTLTGSVANINTFIAGSNVTFTPASDASGDVTLTTSIDDGGNTGAGGAQTDSDTTTLQIAASNDAPTITAPGSISVTEDVASALTGISFSDIDAGSASVTVTLSVASGTLAATSGGGVTVGGAATALTLTGSVADINTFIAGSNVTFTTASDASTNVTLSVDIDDGGNTGADPGNSGTGSSEAASTTVTLAVTAVNDAPTVTVPATIAVTEDTTTALTGISFADVDAGSSSVTVTLSIGSGALAASSGGGVTVGGTATALTLTGSIANINTFIAGSNLTFTPASDASGDVTLTTSIDDGGNTGLGGAQTDSDTTTLQVTALNDRPNITAPGSISVTEDVSTALTGISFSDVDAGSGSVTVTLAVATAGPSAVNGTLSATSGNGVSVASSDTSTLTLSGTIADINAFIAASSVSFLTVQDATIGYNLTVTIDDGGNTGADPGTSGTGSSEARSTTVALTTTAVNDAPTVTVPATIAVNEDTTTALTGISFADVDAGSASVTVTLSIGSGALAATSGGGVTIGGTTTALTLTGSVANINTFIAGSNVTFTPASDASGDVTLTTSIDDGGNTGAGGAQTDSDTTTLQIAAINDAPAITAPGSISVTEDVASALTGISFSDVDAGSGNVTVTLSVASGTLAATSGGGVTVGGVATALTLTGSVADINTFIAGSNVTFTTASDAASNVTLSVDIDDGGNTGADPGNSGTGSSEAASTTVTLAVTAVNDAPTVTVPATIVVNEDTTTALTGISFADVDAGSSVTVTLSIGSGALAASSGGGVTVGGTATVLTLTGSIANINTFIAGSNVVFTPASDSTADVTLTTSIDDAGNTGAGGAQTDSETTTLTLVAVNDAPSITAPGSISVIEDVAGALTGISFSDLDAGGSSVTVTLSVASGSLAATSGNGVSIAGSGTGSLTLTGSVADINAFIAASGVSFTTAADSTSNITLNVSIDDGGNTGSDPGTSGTANSEGASTTVTLAVTAVNDAPVVTAPATLACREDTGTAVTGISFADVDAGSSSVTATLSVSGGSLAVTGTSGVTVGGTSTALTLTGTLANINAFIAASNVFFLPATNAVGDVTLTSSINDGGNTGSGGARTHSATTTLNVAAVNDRPSISAPGSIAVTEDVAGALTGISFADIDAGSSSVTVTLSAASGSLAATSAGGVSVAGSGTGSLTLTGSVADINAFVAASGVSFTTAANAAGNVTLNVSIDDGGNTGSDPGTSGTGSSEGTSTTVTLAVAAVNDAPVVTAPATLAFTEDTGAAVTGISFADVDAGSGAVTATLSVSAGSLAATSGSGVTVGGTSSALTLTGTLADINAFIAASNVTFTSASNATAEVTLTSSIDDGGNTGSGGAQTHSATTTLSVAAINDRPTISAPGSIAVVEDVAGALTGISFADVDAGSGSVTVTLATTSGTLAAASGSGVAVAGSGTGALTLTGTVANINAFIAASGVSFTSAANSIGNVTLDVSIDDGGNTGADPGTSGTVSSEDRSTSVTLLVTAVNDAPLSSLPSAQNVDQDASLVFNAANGNLISVTDIDATGAVQVTLTAVNGTLTLSRVNGLTFSAGDGAADATLTFTGSLGDINAALHGLTFAPTGGYNGAASLQIVVNDQGGSGTGGALSDSDTIAITVDPIESRITGVSASSPNGSYGIGDTITLTVSFDSVVNVDSTGGVPALLLETGNTDRVAVYSGGSGSNTLTFQYVVQAGDVSADLDYASTAALTLNGATIRNASNLDAILDLPPLGAGSVAGTSDLAVDGVRPTVSVVIADTALAVGETSLVTITFSEAVAGFSNADLMIANGTLSAVSSADGGITWTATFTPTANVTDTSNLIVLNDAGVQDVAGNVGVGTTASNNYAVDTARPTATIVVADTALAAGESTQVTITFSEAVSGFSNADLTVANGTLSAVSSSDGGLTWTATFTPTANLADASNIVTLDNTGVTDAAGNAGAGTTDSNDYVIETSVPAVLSVNAPANGSYVAGQSLDFTVNLSEAVLVDTAGGVPRIAITLDGGTTIFANYVSGSGGAALLFRATVTTGLLDLTGISAGSTLDLNGATVRDAAGNDALLALNNFAGTTGVQVDAVAPTAALTLLGNASPDSDTLTFELETSEAVSGVSVADFALLSTGSVTGQVMSVQRIDAQTYQITIGNVQGEGTLALSLIAAGSGIVDAAGNALAGNVTTTARDVDTIPTPVPSSDAPPPPPASAPTTPPPVTPLIVLPSAAAGNNGVGTGAAASRGSPTVENILAPSNSSAAPTTPVSMPVTDTRSATVLPAGSLLAAPGSYVNTATSGAAPLQALPDLGVYTVTSGPLSITLPSSTFTVADGNAQVSVEARLANGQPLPGWLKFDARSGTLSGKPPAGFNGSLDVEVTARDTRGNRASSQLHIDVKALRPTAGRPALDAQFKSVRHAAEKDAQLLRHLDAAARQRATVATKS